MKLINLILVIIILSATYTYAAQPDKSFLQSKITCGNGYADVNEFVSLGLKPGQWEKSSNNTWLYRINTIDQVTKQKNIITIMITKKGNDADIDRMVVNGRELNIAAISNFTLNTCRDLPTVKRSIEEYNTKRIADDKNKLISDNTNYYYKQLLGTYINEETDFNDHRRKKIISIKSINNKVANFDFTSKNDDIIICHYSIKNASVVQDRQNFTLSLDKGECQIQLKASTPIIDHPLRDEKNTVVDIKYRGNCEKYCDFSNANTALQDYKELYYPTGNDFLDLKFEEKNNKKRKSEEEGRWK